MTCPLAGLALFDVVRVVCDIPDQGIVRGAEGTIVEILEQPSKYVVEFADCGLCVQCGGRSGCSTE